MIDFPELPFHSGVREVLDSRAGSVCIQAWISLGHSNRDVCYTRIERPRRAAFLTKRSVIRIWKRTDWLRTSGVAVPQPLFAVIPAGSADRAYLATEWIGGVPLPEIVQRCAGMSPVAQPQQAAAIGKAVGRLLGQLRRAGCTPRQLGVNDIALRHSDRLPRGYRAWLRRALTGDFVTTADADSRLTEFASTLIAGIADPEPVVRSLIDAYVDASGADARTRAQRAEELLQAVVTTAYNRQGVAAV